MRNTYMRIEAKDDNVIIYLHFLGEDAVRQIDITPDGIFLTTTKFPFNEDAMLYDQDLSDLDDDSFEIISELEFNAKWEEYDRMD